MDPATVIALCKENIQPLRYGRNAAQLGTALRAQEDAETQQLLLQEKQMYEDAIRNYEGDDPLENWYEYISWIEQSYPKSGHESHIGKLLQQCLAIFEKETKYYQDQRYIRLWINYINMQKNPLELYQLLYNNGIGTMVADMYRAWAFELEQIEDYKQADEIYLLGLRARAEPLEELDYAHKNFQLAVARKTLGHVDERGDTSLFEQRQAFSSLKAIKAGKKVGTIRTGHRVRDYLPGSVPQVTSMPNTRPNARVQIYQDDMHGEMKGASILDHVPIEDMMHKENTIKPGPWNTGIKKSNLLSSSVKTTAFKIHEDDQDDHDMQKIRLFPNHTSFFDGSKYSEHIHIPVYVPDRTSVNVILKPHYPKDIVYANNMDISMEEIRAQHYLLKRQNQEMQKKYSDLEIDDKCSRNVDLQNQQKIMEREPQNPNITLQELQKHRHDFVQQQQQQQQKMVQRQHNLELQRREVEHLDIERHRIQIEQQELQRQYEVDKQTLENQRQNTKQQQELKRLEIEKIEAERIEAERIKAERIEAQRIEAQRIEAERIEAQRIEAERIEAQRIEAERLEAQRIEAERIEAERIEAQRIEAERIEAERIEAQRMEAELNTQRKLQTSYLHPHHTSSLSTDNEEHLLGQSLTVNTKEAISAVQDLWHSPSITPATPRFRNPITPRMTDSRTKLSFDIHMDSSMTQHAMSNKHHQGFNIQPYEDQENHQSFHTSHQSYVPPAQHTPYGNHGLQNTYHYPIPHHDQQVQQLSHHPHHQMMHPPQQPHQQPHQQQHQQQHQQPHQQPHQQSHQQAHSLHHQSLSQSQHLQSHSQLHHSHSQIHHSPHSQHLQHQQHHPHHHMQQMQHPSFSNMLPNDIGYQQYPPSLDPALLQQNSEPQKPLHYSSFNEPNVEANKPYRMPPELPYIKSPGMNRRDLKYLENAENKENAIVVDYNGPPEENMPPKLTEEDNLYTDDNLGISPLSGPDETCYTEACNALLSSSTPMTNHFRLSHRPKDVPEFSNQNVPHHTIPDVHNGNTDEKLSVIMESTREYVSSSSASSANTRIAALGFTLTREEMSLIKESSIQQIPNDSILAGNPPYEQKMRAQIQAVNAQSPRTVQRNVDQITSEIKNNCDLRKSITFKMNSEIDNQEKTTDTMECEEHEPMEQVEEETFQLPSGNINPFDKNLIAGLLRNMKFPQPQHAEGYVRLNTNLNKLVPSTIITLGPEAYNLEKCLGKGMYGTVYKAVNMQTGQTVALKTQKPAWVWEYYIVREIKARLTNAHMLRGFMDVSIAYITNNVSVLVSEYSKFGTLLTVTNQFKLSTGKPLNEPLAIFFTIEMLQIVEHLHKCQIIHGDIKPDNFLVMRLPTEDVRPTIQLIDFGCSIDMSLLPDKTTFTHIIKTEEFTCIEMQTGRPWTYQTDLYCLAATSHCLLFGNYMRVSNVGDRWFINSKLPRYAKKTAWEPFFTELLNIESCEKLPDLCKLRNVMEEALPPVPELQSRLRHFSNILNNR
ncbi:PREDICTED: uncharacterized protein LOC107073858 isoform X2 [Polistes dominula]|uniref:Uncharacterized protein LOC107073858 isoform X2 n=1 Tax=Polistes dominula TaxID=743375 RepID=A0ABM1JCE2_POLDO|nr:PREDICTED: uncharacterized protein LOC107073858 isoform X2 [Polistes dominula]